MALDLTRFLLSRSLIEREGVTTSDATRLAIVPSIVQMPLAQSVVLATAIGRREAPPPAATPASEQIEMPDVVDQNINAALTDLAQGKLQPPAFVFVDLEGKAPWTVAATEPQAGAKVDPATPVTVKIRVMTGVPGVVGKRWSEAIRELSNAGLCFEIVLTDKKLSAQAGKVLSQLPTPTPENGRGVGVGTTVTLTVRQDDSVAQFLPQAENKGTRGNQRTG